MSLLPKSENNKERFAALLELLTSNSIRDNADNAFLATFQDVLLMNSDIITANVDSDSGDEEEITIFWEIIRIMISFPELDLLKASTLPWFSVDNINKLFGDILRLACTMSTKYKHAKGGGGGVSLSRHICCLIHWLYSLRPDLRPFLRKCITKSLLTVGSSAGSRADAGAGPCRAHVLPILELLLIILEGIDATYETALKSLSTLLQSVLLPLHCPNEMVEWRTQVPVIQAYHPTLVKCIVVIVKKEHEVSGGESNLLQHSISGLLSRNIWPGIENANNIKEILLLQELDTFLNICSPEDARVVQSAVLARICDSCGRKTEHIRVIQRALLLLKNVHIIKLLLTDDPTIALNAMCELVRTLFRAGEKSWNPSVNRMTSQALLQLQSVDKNLFDRAAGCLLDVAPKSITNNKIDTAPTSSSYVASVQSSSSVSLAPFPAPSPLPPKAPLTALKNLPWYATRMNDGVSKQNPHFSMTVTGVAPWAQERSHTPVPQVSSSYSTDTSIPINPPPLTIKATMTSGSEMLHEYITKCLSPVGNEDEDESKPPAERSWSKAAQAISPTLQPDMRFHDLVFGQDLGSGAFSTVRYGRHICRDRSRTAWPEYAIKIISAKKIAECNYTANVEREMAILHLLSHPGISRLISTFRYKECAYLVLEYATGGDLHTLVMRQGRLSELGVRFVVGEVAAALLSVHELGIVYMDLKPENVLVTASGHVKLTDFGGARPLTSAAHEHVNRSKGLLLQLRNGDWKDVDDSDPTNTVSSQSMQKLDECSADDRIEGTPGYMAPETLTIGTCSIKSDAWSLGCLAHFLSHGRPLFCGDREEVLRQIFEGVDCLSSVNYSHKKVRFADNERINENSTDDELASSYIGALLEADMSARMSVEQSVDHLFLTRGSSPTEPSLDPRIAHTLVPPVCIATVDPGIAGSAIVEDESWKRRQLSVLIAPMPSLRDYSSGVAASDAGFYNITGVNVYTLTPIREEKEEKGTNFL